jgi:uncharacterized protein with FMN-binding domain
MIHTAAVSRPVRVGIAALGVAGALALAGCSAPGAATTEPADTDAGASTAPDSGSASGGGAYADGTYTAEGSYATPESVETIEVTVTLADDVITDVQVAGDPQKSESADYQGRFIGGIADVVVGQDIDEISVSRVAGSSLTSGGFNQAIEAIKAEAAA